MNHTNLQSNLERLRNKQIDEDKQYFLITITANKKGEILSECFSQFAGFTKSSKRCELRKARYIDPVYWRDYQKSIGEPALILDNEEDLWVFDIYGGIAIIEESICEEYFPQFTTPFEVIQVDFEYGYVSPELVPKYVFGKVTPKNRRKILNRDVNRCKLCGSSKEDCRHVSLELHHILPQEKGGLTIDSNLITLCRICHMSLKPHYDRELYDYITEKSVNMNLNDYVEGLQNYQKIIKRQLRDTAPW
ncbi:HNH endonuclease [Petrocella sp. FN5]|uniref:HNH endonuclease n=1 Tax=Petrocella sp. FN5 TaxID=3032002 RepID=UPI0023D9A596|nr:HNH endonuclease [Petrocella sp. FN5]MDF1617289.1 HNH endonuclease [Petrocella sp. FN5]